MSKPAMPLICRLYRDKSQMDLGPESLGLKDTQSLVLQERGGLRSNPQFQAPLPNSASALSLCGPVIHRRFMAKEQEKSHVLAAWFCALGFNH